MDEYIKTTEKNGRISHVHKSAIEAHKNKRHAEEVADLWDRLSNIQQERGHVMERLKLDHYEIISILCTHKSGEDSLLLEGLSGQPSQKFIDFIVEMYDQKIIKIKREIGEKN